jgi:hypothetical protein
MADVGVLQPNNLSLVQTKPHCAALSETTYNALGKIASGTDRFGATTEYQSNFGEGQGVCPFCLPGTLPLCIVRTVLAAVRTAPARIPT